MLIDELQELADRLGAELGVDQVERLVDGLHELAWLLDDGLPKPEPYRSPSKVRTKHAGDVIEERTHNSVVYRNELTRCGKATCRCATEGAVHGPYWYAYTHDRGRVRKHYIGKKWREWT